jgi:hypothetical protein
MTSTITRAAQAEKRAEAGRQAAEAEWRQAWWTTTMALAKPEGNAQATQAYDEAEAILGQSRSYLAKRRQAGRAFMAIGPEQVADLEPRKALAAAAMLDKVDRGTARLLRESEEAGESLREFSARLSGTAWSIGSPDKITEAITANPEIVAQAIADSPDLAAHVVRAPGSGTALAREANIHQDEIIRKTGMTDPAKAEREKADADLRKYGPGFIEVLEWVALADKMKAAAAKFITPESGATRYSTFARTNIEESGAIIRASLAHVEAVILGGLDTRIPDDISSLVVE